MGHGVAGTADPALLAVQSGGVAPQSIHLQCCTGELPEVRLAYLTEALLSDPFPLLASCSGLASGGCFTCALAWPLKTLGSQGLRKPYWVLEQKEWDGALQDALTESAEKRTSTREVDGQQFYDYDVIGPVRASPHDLPSSRCIGLGPLTSRAAYKYTV